MTSEGRRPPPASSRFRKGQSGNPKGRPRKVTSADGAGSAFDIIVDRTLTVTRNGESQEVSVEEALQHRTYQAAITGNRSARREVLKMIVRREQALAKRSPARPRSIIHRQEYNPDNANDALLLLGIAVRNPRDYGPDDTYDRLLLEPWAVQMALGRRRGGTKLTEKEIDDILRCTRDPETLKWPRGSAP